MIPRTEAPEAARRPARRRALVALPPVAVALAATAALLPTSSPAVSLPDRTLRVSTDLALGDSDGASQNPSLSVDGRTLAMETTAPDVVPDDLNGPVSDIVGIDLVTGVRRLVTEAAGGADGPSVNPSISGDGRVIAFVSAATNLVPGDTNGRADVFVRSGRSAVVTASVAPDGSPANGPSYQPDMSNDGRFVVFTSEASNLVAGDTNGRADVFARDLATGRTELVSRSSTGGPVNGRSSQPAVSGDGRIVTFESAGTNLVAKDTNGVADVFVRDRATAKTERISVSTSGGQQDKAVPVPFTMIPDLSRDGRYVVFESDATKLTAADGNGRTDVFLRDRKSKTTRIVSASSYNVQGDNDSFNPRITANGRYVAFQSFATNLVAKGDDGPREDLFVRDLKAQSTAVATVANRGRRSAPPAQFLQRPAVSNDARVVAFASNVADLVPNDGNGAADVFLRRLDAPATRVIRKATKKRRSITVGADDPATTRYLCRVDQETPFDCGPTIRFRTGSVLTVRAGGPGLLHDPDGVRVRMSNDRRRPTVRIRAIRGKSVRVIRGTASDRGGSGLRRVEVSVGVFAGKAFRCRNFDGRKFVLEACTNVRYITATGRTRWTLRLPRSVKGIIGITARSVDGAGNRSTIARRAVVLR